MSKELKVLEYLKEIRKEDRPVFFSNGEQMFMLNKDKQSKYDAIEQALLKAQEFENVLKKYNIESIEELEDTIKIKKALELAFAKHRG